MSESIVVFETTSDQRGFVMLPNIVLMDPSLSPQARLMYALFMHYARQKNTAYPGMASIAKTLGLSQRRALPYRKELEEAMLLRTERRGQKSNLYTLLSLERRVQKIKADRTNTSDQKRRVNRTNTSGRNRTQASDEVKAGEVKAGSERARARKRAIKVAGKPVAKVRWATTEAILAEYNRQAKSKLRLLTSAGQPSLAAQRIYKVLQNYPDVTFEEHADIIRRTLASRWWGRTKPSIGVVYGPRVFEDNIARDPEAASGPDDKISAAFAEAREAAEAIAQEEAEEDAA